MFFVIVLVAIAVILCALGINYAVDNLKSEAARSGRRIVYLESKLDTQEIAHVEFTRYVDKLVARLNQYSKEVSDVIENNSDIEHSRIVSVCKECNSTIRTLSDGMDTVANGVVSNTYKLEVVQEQIDAIQHYLGVTDTSTEVSCKDEGRPKTAEFAHTYTLNADTGEVAEDALEDTEN